MIVRDFDFVRMACLPAKADSILVINPDAELFLSSTSEPLEAISGKDGKIVNITNPVNLHQPNSGHWPELHRTCGASGLRSRAIENVLRAWILEGGYNGPYYNA
jgi:hypothetical protein